MKFSSFLLIALCTLTSVTCSQNQRDTYENNNSRQSASNIVEGEIQEHTIYPARDKDWLIFTSPKAGQYTVTLSNQSVDLKGVVYVQMGLLPAVELASFNSFKPGRTWDVGITPTQSNVKYFIGIWASNQDQTGRYEIEISEFDSNSPQTKKTISNISTSGLIAYYPFNGNAKDKSGNGYNGVVNEAQLTTDRFNNSNNAYYFNGYNSYIDLGQLPPIKDYSVSIWFAKEKANNYPPNTDKEADLFGTEQPSPNIFFKIGFHGAYPDRPMYGIQDISIWAFQKSDIEIRDKQWHHLVVTRKGTSIKMYVDGDETDMSNLSVNGFPSGTISTGEKTKIGVVRALYFNGKIDDVRIYSRVLSKSEIEDIYHEEGW